MNAVRTSGDALGTLRQALRARGGTLAATVSSSSPRDAQAGPAAEGPPQVAARGPRVRGREQEYELLMEMILEGSLLHYGSPRVVRAEDPDLALLLGDELYALGLVRLAELGDLPAVRELGDLISLVAEARVQDDPALASAAWAAAVAGIGWGTDEELEQAKASARAGEPEAAAELLAVAARIVGEEGRRVQGSPTEEEPLGRSGGAQRSRVGNLYGSFNGSFNETFNLSP